jgi:hypothetical protein
MSVDDDLQVRSAELSIGMRNATLGLIKPEARMGFLNSIEEYIQLANNLRYHYGKSEMKQRRQRMSNQQLVGIFRVLEESGTLRSVMDAPRMEKLI